MTLKELYDVKEKEKKQEDAMVATAVVTKMVGFPGRLLDSYTMLNFLMLLDEKDEKNTKLLQEVMSLYGYNARLEPFVTGSALMQISNADIENYKKLQSMQNIRSRKGKFILDTAYGRVDIYKACEYFKDNKAVMAFMNRKNWQNKCHQATTEFIEEFKDSEGVVRCMPYFFKGFLYHSYILMPKENVVLDLSSNLVIPREQEEVFYGPEKILQVDGEQLREGHAKIDPKEAKPFYKILALGLDVQRKKL